MVLSGTIFFKGKAAAGSLSFPLKAQCVTCLLYSWRLFLKCILLLAWEDKCGAGELAKRENKLKKYLCNSIPCYSTEQKHAVGIHLARFPYHLIHAIDRCFTKNILSLQSILFVYSQASQFVAKQSFKPQAHEDLWMCTSVSVWMSYICVSRVCFYFYIFGCKLLK